MFGADKHRRLVVTLGAGDLIVMRPSGTRREITLDAADVYHYAIRCRANLVRLEKARETKAKKAAQRERRNLDAAERRLRASAKNNT